MSEGQDSLADMLLELAGIMVEKHLIIILFHLYGISKWERLTTNSVSLSNQVHLILLGTDLFFNLTD